MIDEHDVNRYVASQLKLLRTTTGLTQKAVAQEMRMSPQQVQNTRAATTVSLWESCFNLRRRSMCRSLYFSLSVMNIIPTIPYRHRPCDSSVL